MSSNYYKNKITIITGATSGIGRQLALDLAERGANLVLAARSKDKLEEMVSACESIGAQAIAVVTDVTRETDCKQLIETAAEKFGGIDILINNAGVTIRVLFEDMQTVEPFGAADIHTGPLSDRLQAFQHLNIGSLIAALRSSPALTLGLRLLLCLSFGFTFRFRPVLCFRLGLRFGLCFRFCFCLGSRLLFSL